MFDDLKSFIPKEIEEKVLKFWQEKKIFEKSVNKKAPKGDYVFYDGPPFATGLPHYGHILANIIKDAIPRYQTMKGKKVERVWGWDCHGLPIENIIEEELGLKTKKDIFKIGVAKFNKAAHDRVFSFAGDWKKIIPRIGRWVDMENDYKTMDADYTESVLWVFKKLFDKGLIYEGYKSMHICPRCETTLSNFEVTQNYKEIDDISVYVKAELIEPTTNDKQPTTYLLAWTTTPWTLPGNVALAVNPDIEYAVVKFKNLQQQEEGRFILAKNRLEMLNKEYEIIKTISAKEIIGKQYRPIFDYYFKDEGLKNRENGWKIYPAGFVSREEGTGIVHIAPAFGEDDMQLGNKYKLPFIQHVAMDGSIKKEASDFAGLQAKPKDNPAATDIEIIKWLAHNNKLFKKEKMNHSYPHCWRCDTPLLNYATSSWFVKVTEIKNGKGGLIENNKMVDWIPPHLQKGRFGNWIKDARDWSISRSRFWGAPIPVWKCDQCHKLKVIGSIADIKNSTEKSGNRYFVMRHGWAKSNGDNWVSSKIETSDKYPLTDKGRKEAILTAQKLKDRNIDFIFYSEFERTKQTAFLVAEKIGLSREKVIPDRRLMEVNVGIFEGKRTGDYHKYFNSIEEKFYKTPPGGENLTELKKRVGDFLYDTDRNYSGKNILIVSHEYPIWNLFAAAEGANPKKAVELKGKKNDFIKTGEVRKLDFTPVPHDDNYELDLHRPFIDEVEFKCVCGGEMRRVPDVFDCWFESGSMPYGQSHYPFENKKKFEKNFPAEFIAEGVDQTRGWFYTLLVLSSALFGKPAYKNVIANGIILAEDGQKMSKRLKNYPDPMELVNRYGADALRLYLLSSPAVRAESLNFLEKGVDDVYKKTILRLWNSYSFYRLYTDKKANSKRQIANSKNVLDKWILTRLQETINQISGAINEYELDKASQPIGDFVEDLSTWYIRRSRERFKNSGTDQKSAIATTHFVLSEFSKAIAPITPFISEALFKSLQSKKQSLHLEDYPLIKKLAAKEKLLIEEMKEARKFAELALAKRQEAGIKVRQPLFELRIKNYELRNKNELLNLVKDEVNMKEIVFDKNIATDVELDIVITQELKDEGQIRELTRMIQDLRKQAGYQPKDTIVLYVEAESGMRDLIDKYTSGIKKSVGAKSIEFKRTDKFGAETETKIDNISIWLGVKKN